MLLLPSSALAGYVLESFEVETGPNAGEYPANIVPGADPRLSDETLNGPTVYGGYGCDASDPIPPRATAGLPPLGANDEAVVVLQRGPLMDPNNPEETCPPGEKAENGVAAGYDAVLLANHHAGEAAGLSCDSGGFPAQPPIAAICTTHAALHVIFGEPNNTSVPYPPGHGPPLGDLGERVRADFTFVPDPAPPVPAPPVRAPGAPSTPPPGPAPRPALKPGACANPSRATAVRDTLSGTPAGDALFGLGGSDLLLGLAGDDCLFGGPGADRLAGGPGSDRLQGDGAGDILTGGSGSDRLLGGSGGDRLSGESGDERISGGRGRDRISGGGGSDRINPGSGNDRIAAGSGDDRISASGGQRDTIDCGPGPRDLAIVDRLDRTRRCERVRRRG